MLKSGTKSNLYNHIKIIPPKINQGSAPSPEVVHKIEYQNTEQGITAHLQLL
jgi:hypothetical protein